MRAIGSQTSVRMRQEHTWGTMNTKSGTKTYDLSYRSCSLGSSKNTFQSDTISSTRAVMGIGDGNKAVQGNIVMDLYPEGLEVFFRHLLGKGTLSPTGSGPYVHTLNGEADTMSGLSIEKGYTNIAQYFLYTGCRINSMSIDIVQEGFHGVTFEFIGKAESVNSSQQLSGTATAITKDGYTGYECTVTVDGNVESKVKSGSINISNDVETDGYVLGSQERVSAEYNKRKCSGEFVIFFEDVTLYNKYIAGTEMPIEFTFTNGTDSLAITFPACKLSGEAPPIDSTGGINLSLKFEAKYDSTTSKDVSFVITNDLATIEEEPTTDS